MKRHNFVYLIFIVMFFVSVSRGQTFESNVYLTNKLLTFDKNELKLEFTVENYGSKNIYVATDPTLIIGKHQYYLLIDENDESLLKVSSCVYPDPPYYPIVNQQGVTLRKVIPNERHLDTVTIKFPAKETAPPFYEKENKRETISSEKINRIELTIGYFVEEAGLLDFLNRKIYGWYVSGQETLHVGEKKDKSFLEIQNLVSVDIPVSKTSDFLTKNQSVPKKK